MSFGELVSYAIGIGGGTPILIVSSKKGEKRFIAALIAYEAWTIFWASKLHGRVARQIDDWIYRRRIWTNSYVRACIISLINREIVFPGPFKCTLCGARLTGTRYYLSFRWSEKENGRRYVISCEPAYDFHVNICSFCNDHHYYFIFIDVLKHLLKIRNQHVRKSNLIKSLMVQRYLRNQKRLPRELECYLMSFVSWTPVIEFVF